MAIKTVTMKFRRQINVFLHVGHYKMMSSVFTSLQGVLYTLPLKYCEMRRGFAL